MSASIDRASSADYTRHAEAELDAAAAAPDPEARRRHLDRAAVYAHLAEQAGRRGD